MFDLLQHLHVIQTKQQLLDMSHGNVALVVILFACFTDHIPFIIFNLCSPKRLTTAWRHLEELPTLEVSRSFDSYGIVALA